MAKQKKTETDVETLIYKMSTELALTGQVSENSKTELGRQKLQPYSSQE